MQRRRFLALAAAGAAVPAPGSARAAVTLPMATVFKGEADFHAILAQASREGWADLPIGQRVIKVGYALRGRPYKGFTLEIHDRIESPSVNLQGLDCWTFFEICLGFARMLGWRKPSPGPADLLREIEFTRYRGGVCHGNYLDRIHYLAEWFFENEARGVAKVITRDVGDTRRVSGRKVQEMTVLWKSYRYLRENPDLRPAMAEHERRIEKLPVYYIPKDRVKRAEPKLRDGDIAGIVTKHHGGFCSHVGLITRTRDGVARFFHASTKYKRVAVDDSISDYLASVSGHAGVIIARPNEVNATVTDPSVYQANLRRLVG
jgi:hypothetical protein